MARKEVYSQIVSDMLSEMKTESDEEKRTFLRTEFNKAVQERDPWKIFRIVVSFYPLDQEGSSTREMIVAGAEILKKIADSFEGYSIWKELKEEGLVVEETEDKNVIYYKGIEEYNILGLLDLAVDYLILPEDLLIHRYKDHYETYQRCTFGAGGLAVEALGAVLGIKLPLESLLFFGAEYYERVVWNKERLEKDYRKWDQLGLIHEEDKIFESGIRKYITNIRQRSRSYLEEKLQTAFDPWDFHRIARGFLYLGGTKDREEARIAAEEGLGILEKTDEALLGQSKNVEAIAGLLLTCSLFDYSSKGDFVLLIKAQEVFERMLGSLPSEILPETVVNQLLSSREELSVLLDQNRRRERKIQPRVIETLLAELESLNNVLITKKVLRDENMPESFLQRLTRRLTQKLDGGNDQAGQIKLLKTGEKLKTQDGAEYLINSVCNGGQSVVYRVENQIGQEFALRLLGDRIGLDEQRLRRLVSLRRQAPEKIRARIQQIFEIKKGKDKERYLLMEWLEGKSLFEKIEKNEMSEAESVEIIRKIAEVLEYIHSQEVAHLDIKPANIMIQPDGEVVIIDWDSARREGENVSRSGTLDYVAPEVLAKESATTASDIYSLGATLAEMLTGKPQTIGVVGSQPMPLFSLDFDERFPGIEKVVRELKDVVKTCTDPVPGNRPTAKELLKLFGKLVFSNYF